MERKNDVQEARERKETCCYIQQHKLLDMPIQCASRV